MNDLEIAEAVCLYCPMRFTCTIDPCLCADCQDYIESTQEDYLDEFNKQKTDKS